MATCVPLTADLIEAFAGTFLSARYDGACPVPPFHRSAWAMYASAAPQAMCIAPRDHAKSTSLTFVFILASTLFRNCDYVILVGSTEDKAGEQLSNISEELETNEDIRREFGIVGFETSQKTEIIVKHADGHRFRILARGGEQKIRGAMWNGKRPNLIVCDDMEDDEQVESKDRRRKFRKWFFRAAKQALSKTGKIRVHGTILHEDSLLSRLRKNKMWQHQFYKAHAGFDDFTELLWPERWTELDLRNRRQEFIEDGDSGGYSTEFLNDPQDSDESYLRREDFLPMELADYNRVKKYCAAADFAVSKADHANRTSFTIGGLDTDNTVHVIDQHVGRWDSSEWIDEMFLIQEQWDLEVFWVEDGVIWLSVKEMLYRQMRERNIFINIEPRKSIKDKATRGRSLQRRMRASGMRWDKQAPWYAPMEDELLKFTGNAAAKADDQFDSAALLSLGFDTFEELDDDDFMSEDEMDMIRDDPRDHSGRSEVTGY